MTTIDLKTKIKKTIDELSQADLRLATDLLDFLKNRQQQKQIDLTSIFPWARALSEGERTVFLGEILQAIKEAVESRNWSAVEEIIDTWKEIVVFISR